MNLRVTIKLCLLAIVLSGCSGDDPYDRIIELRQGKPPDAVASVEFGSGRGTTREVVAVVTDRRIINAIFGLVAGADEWEVRGGDTHGRSYDVHVIFKDGARANFHLRAYRNNEIMWKVGIYEDDTGHPRADVRYHDVYLKDREIPEALRRLIRYLPLPREEQDESPLKITGN